MKIIRNTGSYNDRRYGKPWIAKVDFSVKPANFIWGDWTGSPGGEGVLEIDAEPGDIIARGQKDNRKPRNSAPDYYALTDAGKLDHIGDKGAAYKFYLETKKA